MYLAVWLYDAGEQLVVNIYITYIPPSPHPSQDILTVVVAQSTFSVAGAFMY